MVVRAWSLRREERRRRTGRGLFAAVASVLLPGAGQLVAGRRRRGMALLAWALVLGLVLAWVVSRPAATLVAVAVHPAALPTLLVANLVLLAVRLWATLDAYVAAARPPAWPPVTRPPSATLGTGLALVLLVALVSLPHLVIGHYALAADRLLDAVFAPAASGRVSADAPAGPASPTVGGTIDQAAGEGAGGDVAAGDVAAGDGPVGDAATGDAAAGAGGGGAPASTGAPAVVLDLAAEVPPSRELGWPGDRLTVAILGSDGGPGRRGDRLDAMLVATVDPASGAAAVFSVDRYLRDFPLPEGLAALYARHCPHGPGWEYLNALYRCGTDRIADELAARYPTSPDPAATFVGEVLGDLLGLPVDHVALVDLAGFVGVVDALGGVEVDVARPLRVRLSPAIAGDPWRTFDLPAGPQVLDGQQALAFVRSRTGTGDQDRMRRQRCLVASIVAASEPSVLLARFPRLAAGVEAHVATDLPVDRLPALIALLPRVRTDEVVALGFGPPSYRGPDHVPDVAAIRARVTQVLDEPEVLELDAEVERGLQVCG